jgi:UDP-glucuronate decarboxylase
MAQRQIINLERTVTRASTALQYLAGRKLLLTGGLGFLGRHFADVIGYFNESRNDQIFLTLADNYSVSSGFTEAYVEGKQGIEFIKCDFTRPLPKSLVSRFDVIVHAAGIASPFYYRAKPLDTLDVAVNGTRNLLEKAKAQDSKFIFFSSSEIYGNPDPKAVPIMESYNGYVSCRGPRACYDESKRLGETLCYIFHEYHGVHTNIIRPFNVYGPGMQQHDYRVMPNFASSIKSNRDLKVYGSGNQTRTFCFIEDALVGFLKVWASGVAGEPYNIGTSNEEISMLDLASKFATLASSLGYNTNVRQIDYPDSYPSDEPQRRCPDVTKAFHHLGFKAEVALEDGISEFLTWALEDYTPER